MSQERKRMKELAERYGGEIPYNPLGDNYQSICFYTYLVGIQFSMYVGDDLLEKPLDYSFDRGPTEKGNLDT